MTQLTQLQQHFQRYLMEDSLGVDNTWIVNDAKVGAKKRLGIYHNAYRVRIVEALASPYSGLRKLLGHAKFHTLALGYLNRYPSTYPNLRWYGDKMANYLREVLPNHPVAAEMATFEWALAAAFDAPDMPVVTLQALSEIPPEQWGALTFIFHADVKILPLKTNAVAIWKALDAGEAKPASDHQVNLHWLIWRQQLDANFRSMEALEASMLALAMEGLSFAALCEQLEAVVGEDAAMQAAQLLMGWLQAELIAEIK